MFGLLPAGDLAVRDVAVLAPANRFVAAEVQSEPVVSPDEALLGLSCPGLFRSFQVEESPSSDPES